MTPGVWRLLGGSYVSRRLDEFAELCVGNLSGIHPGAVYARAMHGLLIAVGDARVAAHGEPAAGNPDHTGWRALGGKAFWRIAHQMGPRGGPVVAQGYGGTCGRRPWTLLQSTDLGRHPQLPHEPGRRGHEAVAPGVRLLVLTHFTPASGQRALARIFGRDVHGVPPRGLVLGEDGTPVVLPTGSDAVEVSRLDP